ncbi:GNAT family N-acetyltransferase [Galbibacter sp. BG1]|uniref:GNAT family N-acetyltransferase n=1 Tax=Galbibacter sp. BG1 TaxID=1170699 RepID=UPI0015BD8B47|nr:GNAT family N-acetyltransferase [Galbibacter sp. BG1]QLE00046.1 GNAT family N-acetyltransferase [Galbibacter sp. BG1]
MITLIRTDAAHTDFKKLVKHLDRYLAVMDGDAHEFYDQFNKIETLTEVVLAYLDETVVGCGAIKPYDLNTAEIKRMYVAPNCRGKGVASIILKELEVWSKDLSFNKTILETGIDYKDAIALYKKNGYQQLPNYGPYTNSELSICFGKELK